MRWRRAPISSCRRARCWRGPRTSTSRQPVVPTASSSGRRWSGSSRPNRRVHPTPPTGSSARSVVLAQFLKSFVSQRSPGQILALLASAKDLHKKGEPRAAIATYHKALKAGAPAAEVHLQLGVLHAELSEHDAAIGELQKAIALAPDNADAICMLGTVMSDLRRPNEAAALFERAIGLQPQLS